MASTTVTIEPLSTHTAYGAPSFDAAVEYVAHVEEDVHLIRRNDGQEVLTKFRVFVMSSSALISAHDRIAAAGSTELSIAQVLTLNDDEGQHHVELLLT
jgi:hypothetical protein